MYGRLLKKLVESPTKCGLERLLSLHVGYDTKFLTLSRKVIPDRPGVFGWMRIVYPAKVRKRNHAVHPSGP